MAKCFPSRAKTKLGGAIIPYIKPGLRSSLNTTVATVMYDIAVKQEMEKADPAGMVTYVIYKLLRRFFSGSYRNFALGMGVLFCSALEFYRRNILPYEDRKKAENGDVE